MKIPRSRMKASAPIGIGERSQPAEGQAAEQRARPRSGKRHSAARKSTTALTPRKKMRGSSRPRPPFALDRLREPGPERLLYEVTKPGPGGNAPLLLTPLQLLDRGRTTSWPAKVKSTRRMVRYSPRVYPG